MIDFIEYFVSHDDRCALVLNWDKPSLSVIKSSAVPRGALVRHVAAFRYRNDTEGPLLTVTRDEIGREVVALGAVHVLAMAASPGGVSHADLRRLLPCWQAAYAQDDLERAVATLELAQTAIVQGGRCTVPAGHRALQRPLRDM